MRGSRGKRGLPGGGPTVCLRRGEEGALGRKSAPKSPGAVRFPCPFTSQTLPPLRGPPPLSGEAGAPRFQASPERGGGGGAAGGVRTAFSPVIRVQAAAIAIQRKGGSQRNQRELRQEYATKESVARAAQLKSAQRRPKRVPGEARPVGIREANGFGNE